MTPAELDELERMAAEATPLPWFHAGYCAIQSAARVRECDDLERSIPSDAPEEAYAHLPEVTVAHLAGIGHGDLCSDQQARDAAYIVAACNQAPALVARARALEAAHTEWTHRAMSLDADLDIARTRLRAQDETIARLVEALAVYDHAHTNGNAVPPRVVQRAREALAALAAARGGGS